MTSNLKTDIVTGSHVIGNISVPRLDKLQNLPDFKSFISKAVSGFGFHELGSFYHHFSETDGFTGVVCLSESHIAIHTWPEFNYLTLDVFICDYSKNNQLSCKQLFDDIVEYFDGKKLKEIIIQR